MSYSKSKNRELRGHSFSWSSSQCAIHFLFLFPLSLPLYFSVLFHSFLLYFLSPLQSSPLLFLLFSLLSPLSPPSPLSLPFSFLLISFSFLSPTKLILSFNFLLSLAPTSGILAARPLCIDLPGSLRRRRFVRRRVQLPGTH